MPTMIDNAPQELKEKLRAIERDMLVDVTLLQQTMRRAVATRKAKYKVDFTAAIRNYYAEHPEQELKVKEATCVQDIEKLQL